MRKWFVAIVGSFVLLSACSKSAKYPKDSAPYKFLKRLSVDVPIMDPDKSVQLISSNKFKLRSTDLMPIVFRSLSRNERDLTGLPADQKVRIVNQICSMEGEKRLVAAAAKETGITVTDDSVNAMLEYVYKNMGGKEAFLQSLVTDGWTLDRYRDDTRINLAIGQYLNRQIDQKVTITDQDIADRYAQKRTATVRHILLITRNKPDSLKPAIRTKLEGILARAKKGEDFAKLARLYTEDVNSRPTGGLYEEFEPGDMVPPFDSLAFSLPPGALSEVFETPYGFHIMKVIGHGKEKKPLSAVREKLVRELRRDKRNQLLEEELKRLRLKYEYKELWSAL
jgi:foldase protein PrsA